MAKPSCLASQPDPIRLERMVNEVAAGGRTERLFPITTVRHSVSGRVVWSSRSGDLIHQSRQAGWGLARYSTDRLSRRPASPIRTRRMGSGQNLRPGRGDGPPGVSEPSFQGVHLRRGVLPCRLDAYAAAGGRERRARESGVVETEGRSVCVALTPALSRSRAGSVHQTSFRGRGSHARHWPL